MTALAGLMLSCLGHATYIYCSCFLTQPLTYNRRHDKALVEKSISVVIALKQQEVSIMVDLPSDVPGSGNEVRAVQRESSRN